MKTIKKYLCLTLVICFGFILGVCSGNVVHAEQNYPIKIWAQNTNGSYETLVVVDENTGVNYIVISAEEHGESITVSITPRLNDDGSLYISK